MAAIGMARRGLATGAAAPRTVLETAALVVKSLPVTPFEMNMYLLCCKATGDAAIIDAGDDDVDVWVAAAGDAGATIRHLVQTHGHVDHVAGLAAFKAALPDAPTYLHPLDDWIAPLLRGGASDIRGELDLACTWEPVGTIPEYLRANLEPPELSYLEFLHPLLRLREHLGDTRRARVRWRR